MVSVEDFLKGASAHFVGQMRGELDFGFTNGEDGYGEQRPDDVSEDEEAEAPCLRFLTTEERRNLAKPLLKVGDTIAFRLKGKTSERTIIQVGAPAKHPMGAAHSKLTEPQVKRLDGINFTPDRYLITWDPVDKIAKYGIYFPEAEHQSDLANNVHAKLRNSDKLMTKRSRNTPVEAWYVKVQGADEPVLVQEWPNESFKHKPELKIVQKGAPLAQADPPPGLVSKSGAKPTKGPPAPLFPDLAPPKKPSEAPKKQAEEPSKKKRQAEAEPAETPKKKKQALGAAAHPELSAAAWAHYQAILKHGAPEDKFIVEQLFENSKKKDRTEKFFGTAFTMAETRGKSLAKIREFLSSDECDEEKYQLFSNLLTTSCGLFNRLFSGAEEPAAAAAEKPQQKKRIIDF